MAEYSKEKKYFLKLPKDFFKKNYIKVLKGMPNGHEYALLLLELMCESVPWGGYLRFSFNLPYTPEMISSLTDTNIDIVKNALPAFEGLGIMNHTEDSSLFFPQVEEMITSTTEGAEKKKIQRQGGQQEDKCPPDVKSLDTKNVDTKKETPYQSSLLINQGYTKDKPSVALAPCVEFLFDYGYLSRFDTDDAENVERYSNLFDELTKSYGSRNVHVSIKYFVSVYCCPVYVDGNLNCWRLRDFGEPIMDKFNLLRACMVSNCKRFKDGTDSSIMEKIDSNGIREDLMQKLVEEFPVGGGSNV